MSLESRMDNRSLEVFADNIDDFTHRETLWAEALRLSITRYRKCEVVDMGVDNKGRVVLKSKNMNNPDYLFKFDNDTSVLIDIKTIPEWCKNFFTFKVSSLDSALQKGAIVVVPKLDEYYIFGKRSIAAMLRYDHRIYRGFSPNDLAVRIPIAEIRELSKILMWEEESVKYINENKEELTAEKDR